MNLKKPFLFYFNLYLALVFTIPLYLDYILDFYFIYFLFFFYIFDKSFFTSFIWRLFITNTLKFAHKKSPLLIYRGDWSFFPNFLLFVLLGTFCWILGTYFLVLQILVLYRLCLFLLVLPLLWCRLCLCRCWSFGWHLLG